MHRLASLDSLDQSRSSFVSRWWWWLLSAVDNFVQKLGTTSKKKKKNERERTNIEHVVHDKVTASSYKNHSNILPKYRVYLHVKALSWLLTLREQFAVHSKSEQDHNSSCCEENNTGEHLVCQKWLWADGALDTAGNVRSKYSNAVE